MKIIEENKDKNYDHKKKKIKIRKKIFKDSNAYYKNLENILEKLDSLQNSCFRNEE